MITLSRKADYALVALAYLGEARQRGEGAVSARLIAERFKLPGALLMNILKDLARVKLVRSTRGASGGYTLACDPVRVTLLDVVLAVDEKHEPLTPCACDHDALPILGQASCHLTDDCPVREPIQRLHRRLQRFLAEVTLADLIGSRVNVAADEIQITPGPGGNGRERTRWDAARGRADQAALAAQD